MQLVLNLLTWKVTRLQWQLKFKGLALFLDRKMSYKFRDTTQASRLLNGMLMKRVGEFSMHFWYHIPTLQLRKFANNGEMIVIGFNKSIPKFQGSAILTFGMHSLWALFHNLYETLWIWQSWCEVKGWVGKASAAKDPSFSLKGKWGGLGGLEKSSPL